MDGAAPSRLVVLVERITNKRNPALDTSLLAEIKALCKLGDEHVLLAFDAVYSQLRATHAQTRLLALLLCEQLFLRSRAFRLALLSHLSQFLEAVLGHREERPLPPPPAAAAALRAKGLELLGRWEAQYGRRYRQLSLANKYLRETARVQQLTPVPPGAAEAERAARERRQRAADHARLAALLGGPGEEGRGEWEEGAAAARQLLTELLECFAILEEQRQAQQAQQAAAAAAEQAAAAAGLEWEDIAADAGGAAEQQQHAAGVLKPLQQDEEGLAAYGAAAADNGGGGGTLDSRSTGGAGGGSGAGEEEDAVLETLAGLYRQLANRVLPQLADWLSVLGRSEGSDGRQEAARQRSLRETTALRSRLAAAKERCDALDLDLQALLLRRLRRERERLRQSERRDTQPAAQQPQQQQQQQQQHGHRRQQEAAQQQGQQRGQPAAQQFTHQDEPAVASALQELFGESDGEEDEMAQGGGAAAGTTASQQQQQQRGSAATRSTAAAAGDEDFESPYLNIVDPAAPRPRSATSAAAAPQPQPRQQPGGSSGATAAGSSLPEEVRKKLAAQAPVLPSGLHTIFWDSKSGPAYVSGHGLEVSNHWGPVDVHRELPQERLDEIFMIPMPAQHWQQQQQQQAQQRQAQREGQGAAAPAVAGQRQPQQPSSQGEAGSSGAAARPWPRRREHAGADGAGPSAAAQGTPAPPAAPAAPAKDARVAKRARRAQERAYNEAVIGGADPDAALARQLQDSETHASAGGRHANDDAQRGRGAPPGQRGAAPRRMTVQARLAAKLLRGRALAAAVADETRTESEVRRDKFGNRW